LLTVDALLRACELLAAERIGERRRRVGEEDAGPPQEPQPVDPRPLAQLPAPGPLRPRVGAEPLAARRVRLLVAGTVEARQRRARRERDDPALPNEGLRFHDRL